MGAHEVMLRLLDPIWRRTPFPGTAHMELAEHGPVAIVEMTRRWRGRAGMSVRCFLVGDTLIDTGLPGLGRELAELARSRKVERVYLTHHHEDHAGNTAGLVDAGLRVEASTATAMLVGAGYPIHLYQHVMWGPLEPARVMPFGDEDNVEVTIGGRTARVVRAPGHCEDQVVYHVPSEGWLFSGDAFIHEQVRVFRRDEDFAKTITTLERLGALDFDVLFCAHRPRLTGGRAAIRRKLAWLRDLEGETLRLHAAGAGVKEIAERLRIEPRSAYRAFTLGDVSSANLVRSILFGPTPRV